MSKQQYCRSCRAEVEWHETENGKAMICDPGIVHIDEAEPGSRLLNLDGKLITKRDPIEYQDGYGRVTHWSTCPDANDWHGKKR